MYVSVHLRTRIIFRILTEQNRVLLGLESKITLNPLEAKSGPGKNRAEGSLSDKKSVKFPEF